MASTSTSGPIVVRPAAARVLHPATRAAFAVWRRALSSSDLGGRCSIEIHTILALYRAMTNATPAWPSIFAARRVADERWIMITPSDEPCRTYSASPLPALGVIRTVFTDFSVMYGSRISPSA
jgi:hypothetical protein